MNRPLFTTCLTLRTTTILRLIALLHNNAQALLDLAEKADALHDAWSRIYDNPHDEMIPAEQWPMIQATSDYDAARKALGGRGDGSRGICAMMSAGPVRAACAPTRRARPAEAALSEE